MKKILALVLATLMLLSFTAFATSQNTIQNNMSHVVSDAKNFNTENSASGFGGADSASQRTDVWLQVEASGQIDVTVPLVAIFKTNIDGGKNTIDAAYKIVNNSSANVAVTKVVIEDQETDVSTNGDSSNMTMVKELAGGLVYDQYTLNFTPTNRYDDATAWTYENVVDTFTKDATAAKPTYSIEKNVELGNEAEGLWLIERKQDGDQDESYIKMVLETSKLSFVTRNTDTDLDADDDAAIQNGIKLFTVTYTVKIDDSEAKGGDITMADQVSNNYDGRTDETGTPKTNTYKYLTDGSISITQK